MESTIKLNKNIVCDYQIERKSPNIPSLEILRRSLNDKDDICYPYNHALIGQIMQPHQPLPNTLTLDPGVIIHQTKSIHLCARQHLVFQGLFMAAPVIKLEAAVIELIDSGDPEEPITTIAAQTRLVLNAHEVFFNGVALRCYDAAIDCRAKTIRYANIDLQELQKTAKFPPSCKFLEVEVVDD